MVHLAWLARPAIAQTSRKAAWSARTPWGDPELQGQWTSEGEYGVPFERPPQYGAREFLTDAEYAERLDDVRARDERDLARVDVLAGKVDAPNAPIPHWREYNTTSRRTSLVIDPPDGRLPPRTPQAKPFPMRSVAAACNAASRATRTGTTVSVSAALSTAAGFPDAMFPGRLQRQFAHRPEPGYRRDHLRADSRYAHHPPRRSAAARVAVVARDSDAIMGAARGRWEGTTLVVETGSLKATTRGASSGLRLIERFTRTGRDSIQYQVTFIDPFTWTAPWTAALDLEGASGRRRCVRVRVPRGQLRAGQHAVRLASPRAVIYSTLWR